MPLRTMPLALALALTLAAGTGCAEDRGAPAPTPASSAASTGHSSTGHSSSGSAPSPTTGSAGPTTGSDTPEPPQVHNEIRMGPVDSILSGKYSFGEVAPGETATMLVALRGRGETAVHGVEVSDADGAGVFVLADSDCGGEKLIGPDTTCQISLRFTPPAPGEYGADVSVAGTLATGEDASIRFSVVGRGSGASPTGSSNGGTSATDPPPTGTPSARSTDAPGNVPQSPTPSQSPGP